MAGLIYDREARRLGPLLRGHLLLFDKRDALAYPAASGWVLLVVFVLFELAIGPRLEHLSLLGIAVPVSAVRLPLQIVAVLLIVRLAGNLRWRDIGLLPFTRWTATEGLYFLQVALAAAAIFYFLFLRDVPMVSGPMQAPLQLAGLIVFTQVLWGFYQELMYRGLLQTELTRRFGALWGALIANTAFTFGLLHFYYFHSAMTDMGKAIMFAMIFAIGLFFAFIFARTRNLWIVGVFHGIGNLFMNGGSDIHALLR